ncbi:MAG: class I SAM-dependent methyltransferase [Nibricoccus sp.]
MQHDEYRKLAETEDRMWYFHALHRRIGHFLARRLRSGPACILDAGCGTGGLMKTLATANREWLLTGIDFMPQACALAKSRTALEVLEGSITALPFGDDAFDAIVSADVVCQVEEPEKALREFARCVRSGGLVVVNVPAYMWLWSYHDTTCETKHRYTRSELARLFRSAGLEVEFSSYANFPALPLIALRRKVYPPKNPTSDVKLYSPVVERVFGFLAWLEFSWMRFGLRMPCGSSVFVVGRKTG